MVGVASHSFIDNIYFLHLLSCQLSDPSIRSSRASLTMLVPVTSSVWGMEYSVHACPKKHKAEAEAMFPGLDVSDLLVVPTCQVRICTNLIYVLP